METADQLMQHAGDLLEILEQGAPFRVDDLNHLVEQVEIFCDHYPAGEEIPRKVARLLTELVPALDAASQKYPEAEANHIQDAAGALFVVMLEKL
ncbi:hypothetical protein GC197_09430 [bacterium]|nr:hypothetical protein [bacterium]